MITFAMSSIVLTFAMCSLVLTFAMCSLVFLKCTVFTKMYYLYFVDK